MFYVYGLIDGAWRPIDGKWLALGEANTSMALAIQRGATMIGTYTWDGSNMTWSIG